MSKKLYGETKKAIVVAGDLAIDIFEVKRNKLQSNDNQTTLCNWQSYDGLDFLIKPGGAFLLTEYIRAAYNGNVIGPTMPSKNAFPVKQMVNSFARIEAFPLSNSDKKKTHYRIAEYKGFSVPNDQCPIFPQISKKYSNAELVIIDDAGNGFRDNLNAWPNALTDAKHKPTIFYKMSFPLCKGKLWEFITNNHQENTILIIAANDLRRAGFKLSRRLSWEQTAEEFVSEWLQNSYLSELRNFKNVIIRFGVEGAIWCNKKEDKHQFCLFFDPELLEDSFEERYPGKMIGIGIAFIAALAKYIINTKIDNLDQGIKNGLLAAKQLWIKGFGSSIGQKYPDESIFDNGGFSSSSISHVIIPVNQENTGLVSANWCILSTIKSEAICDLACQSVIVGSEKALKEVPFTRFRNLVTFDRGEIESFQSIANLIKEYINSPHIARPLSLAVFGAPGSGKSFGITEVAEAIAPGRLEKLEFNLSQFTSINDLTVAFHKIRDISLRGRIPIIFFDEFDSEFHGELGWLKFFLAPMQDGQFRDGESMHPLGRALMVFAGGTKTTLQEFYPEKDNKEFVAAKGPDFISRLRGYVNIKSINPMSETDNLYPIRRALSLRHILMQNAPWMVDGKGHFSINPRVLYTLIQVPHYKHGIRSMQAIVEMSMLTNRKVFEEAALPSREQLKLHVDEDEFITLLRGV